MDEKKRIKGEWFDLILRNQIGAKVTPKIVVSLKISKKATDRNRIKRLIKVAVAKYPVLTMGKDLTFIVKTNFAKEKAQKVEERLKDQIEHLR